MRGLPTRFAARAVTAVVLVLVVVLALALLWFHRRALPILDGELAVASLNGPVVIVRDRWSVPHISAEKDEDVYFGLGYAVAQDRLFQLELLRHVGQGRLAELFGTEVAEIDRLFRTLDFQGIGRRRLARARPEVRAAFEAYARGVNTAAEAGRGRRPIEFALLRREFAPVRAEDFVGVLSYLIWSLQLDWQFDPLHRDLVARVGPQRANELFPLDAAVGPAVFPALASTPQRSTLFDLAPAARAFLSRLPRLAASNTWAIAPARSATGHAILANDPHLDVGLPSTWYQAHLQAPGLDVIGATIPGLPFVVIGHNRKIAWGLTNLMLDSGDFFIEKLRPGPPMQVMSQGTWIDVGLRSETIRVQGNAPTNLRVVSTPHGPVVDHLLEGQHEVLAFRWSYAVAEHTNDMDAFYDLNRASDWAGFRRAVGQMGGVAQNISYADRAGHIGLQASGAIPRRTGTADGRGFRTGWDGSQEWDGFVPFSENPAILDPAEGFVVAANHPTFTPPAPFYISSYWEPPDRAERIREFLAAATSLTMDDMRALQNDVVVVSAREDVLLIRAAFAERAFEDERVHAALQLLKGWDGRMEVSSPAAALFAAYYRRLFHEIFDDELGESLAEGYRARANVSAVMIRIAMRDPETRWFDRTDTQEVEDRLAIVRRAFAGGVADLAERWGQEPGAWRWGRMHTLTLSHPLGEVAILAPYFNLGPHPVPGHALTVFKEESSDRDFSVYMGPSLRQITDLGDLAHGLSVLPGGQSGIRASRHYGDLFGLWRAGEYHPLLMERVDIEAAAEGHLVLTLIKEARTP